MRGCPQRGAVTPGPNPAYTPGKKLAMLAFDRDLESLSCCAH